jgi:dTDP-glucose pyrophosphorylase
MSEKILHPQASLMDAVRAIELSRRRMTIVVAEDGKLLGTLTDGDIRRNLMAGGSLDGLATEAMNRNPITAKVNYSDDHLKDLMRINNVIALPLVDEFGRFLRLIHLMDLVKGAKDNTGDKLAFSFAVIMAGGEGTRLRPFTEHIPKPMVEVGGVPLLKRQVERLVNAGISRIYISVNYLGHIIEDYFGDGRDYGVEICYLREQMKLGTAGALSLLPEKPISPIILMNGDILTTFDFDSFYTYHQEYAAPISVAAIDHKINIPYGVIRTNGQFIKELVEKPSERFLCNAGIYAISPEVLSLIPSEKYSNMTDLIDICLKKKIPVAVFPIHEYWSDVGTPEDLEKARVHFAKMEILT